MYRIPLENEQITKALTTPYAPVNYTDAEKEQIVDNIFPSGGNVITSEFISKISTGGVLAKIKKLTGKSVVQSGAIVDAAIKGFGSTGVNLWNDAQTLASAIINNGDGTYTVNSYSNQTDITFKAICPNLKAGDVATLTIGGDGLKQIYFRDNAVTWVGGSYRTVTQEMLDSRIFIYGKSGGGATVIGPFMVEHGTTATPYEPYNPYYRNFTKTLRSVGNVADTSEDVGNAYKDTYRVGSVDLGSLTWTYNTYGRMVSSNNSVVGAKPSTGNNTLCAIFVPHENSAVNVDDTVDKYIVINGSGAIIVRDTAYSDATAFKTMLQTNKVYLNYELATPIVEYHDYNLTYPVIEGGTEYFDSPVAVPCTIEYGVDIINDIVAGVVGGDTERDNAPVLLWENASPNSQFVAQTVSLDLSTYKYVMVMFHEHPSDVYPYKTGIYPIGNKYSVTSFTGASTSVTGAPYFIKRMFTVQNNGITFEGSYYATPTVQMTANNAEFIPVRIYGIK